MLCPHFPADKKYPHHLQEQIKNKDNPLINQDQIKSVSSMKHIDHPRAKKSSVFNHFFSSVQVEFVSDRVAP